MPKLFSDVLLEIKHGSSLKIRDYFFGGMDAYY
jgi:hypothetical protein